VVAIDPPGALRAPVPAGVALGAATPASARLDDTAETIPDTATTLAAEFSKRAELLMLAQQTQQQVLQARIDRMKADFNASQEQRSEAMREMNALRDMAIEQEKKDDEILKKFIAMI